MLLRTHTCAFPPNLFHGQIPQKSINQTSSPENKKCSLWKVFEINHPQTMQLLSRRGPRSSEARLSNVMLRQSRLRASRASPNQKSQGARVVCFLVTLIYIWAICLRNKFDEKAQCEHEWSLRTLQDATHSSSSIYHNIVWITFLYSNNRKSEFWVNYWRCKFWNILAPLWYIKKILAGIWCDFSSLDVVSLWIDCIQARIEKFDWDHQMAQRHCSIWTLFKSLRTVFISR